MNKKIDINSVSTDYELQKNSDGSLNISLGDISKKFSLISKTKSLLVISDGTKQYQVKAGNNGYFTIEGHDIFVEDFSLKRKSNKSEEEGLMISPMPGKIFKILVKEGQSVSKGDALLIMEAMKMEHTIRSSSDGCISKILFNEGDQVTGGVELVQLDCNVDSLA